jgi:pimeloyl-ACP methyl ester carboxylesterase
MYMRVQRVELKDVTLECEILGPSAGPLALCLHGFPDTAHTFRYLAPHLVQHGYRVVVPSMRGYAPSSLSKSNIYSLSALALDAIELHDVFEGDERAVLVGHDWGAAATYLATAAEPSRWSRAVTMALPPFIVFATALGSYRQLAASWYMTFFQNPGAEQTVANDDFDFISQLWATWSPHYDARDDVALVKRALDEPEHLTAAINYYRAMNGPAPNDARLARLDAAMANAPAVPTLYLHGRDDGCILSSGVADALAYLAPQSRMEIIDDAGHFLHLERPDCVHSLIDTFLRG